MSYIIAAAFIQYFVIEFIMTAHSKKKRLAWWFLFLCVTTGTSMIFHTAGFLVMFFSFWMALCAYAVKRHGPRMVRKPYTDRQRKQDMRDFSTVSGSGIMSNNSGGSLSGKMCHDAMEAVTETARNIAEDI